jgi:hypothetical protein
LVGLRPDIQPLVDPQSDHDENPGREQGGRGIFSTLCLLTWLSKSHRIGDRCERYGLVRGVPGANFIIDR